MRRSNATRGLGAGCARALGAALAWGALCVPAGLTAQEEADNSAGPAGAPESYPVRDGDTLWDVSNRYLGSSYEWPRLWSYNPEITNPHWIYPGHVLRLREGAPGGYSALGPGEGAPPAAAGTNGLLRMGAAYAPRPSKVRLGEQTYLDKAALAEAAHIVGSPADHMLFSPSDEVYLQFKRAAEPPAAGKQVIVFMRVHRAELSPKAGKLKTYRAGDGGEIVRVLGAARIETYDADKRIARAVITEAIDPIERGFEVADVPFTLTDVAPKASSKKVEAKIVAATRSLGTLGENQMVFIDAGSKQGVEAGNRFLVVRQGDPWREKLTVREQWSGEARPEPHPLSGHNYPPSVVGEVRVLYVRPESCTGLITSAAVELNPGDRVELREGY